MNTLQIPVSSIGDAGHHFEECVPVAAIQPPTAGVLPTAEVRVSGRFSRVGEEYLFRGLLSGVFVQACYRCLAPATVPYAIEVAWVFAEGPMAVFEEISDTLERRADDLGDMDDAPEPHRTFQGRTINIGPHVWEEIVFAVPSRFVCGDGCKGLCLRCGNNMNEGDCGCREISDTAPIGNHGLAGLVKLYPELAPKTKKE